VSLKKFEKALMSLLAALQFLTTIPIPIRKNVSPAQLGASVMFYPFVGCLLGLLLVGIGSLVNALFAREVVAALLLLAWVLLTGGLHLDGLMDACDGLLSHRDVTERLRIMKDVHVGAWGILGAVWLLITKYAALHALLTQPLTHWASALWLSPMLARWLLSVCILRYPYGRAEGLGQTLHANVRRSHVVFGTICALLFTALVRPLAGLPTFTLGLTALLLTPICAWFIVRFALARLPGLTGDVYGALTEISEAIVLATFTLKL
jgi:cobalamin 5'-phosphate synthase/cobalamin synthase